MTKPKIRAKATTKAAAKPTPQHHINLANLLAAIAAVAPAVAAPFVGTKTGGIIATESGIATAILGAIGKK